MKIKMFIAALAWSAAVIPLTLASYTQAQTTIVKGQGGAAIVIEREGEKPAVLDENKDIKGMVKLPAKVETTGRAELDADGNVVGQPKKDCVDESWLGGGKKGDKKCD